MKGSSGWLTGIDLRPTVHQVGIYNQHIKDITDFIKSSWDKVISKTETCLLFETVL